MHTIKFRFNAGGTWVFRANDGCARAAATFMAAGSSLINYVDFIEPRILFTCSLACVCVCVRSTSQYHWKWVRFVCWVSAIFPIPLHTSCKQTRKDFFYRNYVDFLLLAAGFSYPWRFFLHFIWEGNNCFNNLSRLLSLIVYYQIFISTNVEVLFSVWLFSAIFLQAVQNSGETVILFEYLTLKSNNNC